MEYFERLASKANGKRVYGWFYITEDGVPYADWVALDKDSDDDGIFETLAVQAKQTVEIVRKKGGCEERE